MVFAHCVEQMHTLYCHFIAHFEFFSHQNHQSQSLFEPFDLVSQIFSSATKLQSWRDCSLDGSSDRAKRRHRRYRNRFCVKTKSHLANGILPSPKEVREHGQELSYFGRPRFVVASPSQPHVLFDAFHARKSAMIINHHLQSPSTSLPHLQVITNWSANPKRPEKMRGQKIVVQTDKNRNTTSKIR